MNAVMVLGFIMLLIILARMNQKALRKAYIEFFFQLTIKTFSMNAIWEEVQSGKEGIRFFDLMTHDTPLRLEVGGHEFPRLYQKLERNTCLIYRGPELTSLVEAVHTQLRITNKIDEEFDKLLGVYKEREI